MSFVLIKIDSERKVKIMGKRKVKEYSADFKTKVVLEVLRQDQTQAEIASKYQISAANISMWLKHFLENAEDVFNGKHIAKKHKAELKKKEESIEELHKTIGELAVSVKWLKKKTYGIWNSISARNG